jgi:hypothetical protein
MSIDGDKVIEHLQAENARLRGEVERLKEDNQYLDGGSEAIAELHESVLEDNALLRAQLDGVLKAVEDEPVSSPPLYALERVGVIRAKMGIRDRINALGGKS